MACRKWKTVANAAASAPIPAVPVVVLPSAPDLDKFNDGPHRRHDGERDYADFQIGYGLFDEKAHGEGEPLKMGNRLRCFKKTRSSRGHIRPYFHKMMRHFGAFRPDGRRSFAYNRGHDVPFWFESSASGLVAGMRDRGQGPGEPGAQGPLSAGPLAQWRRGPGPVTPDRKSASGGEGLKSPATAWSEQQWNGRVGFRGNPIGSEKLPRDAKI